MPVAQLCRKHAISSPPYHGWKSKCAGATVSDLTRMPEARDAGQAR
jgi:putative transposase